MTEVVIDLTCQCKKQKHILTTGIVARKPKIFEEECPKCETKMIPVKSTSFYITGDAITGSSVTLKPKLAVRV